MELNNSAGTVQQLLSGRQRREFIYNMSTKIVNSEKLIKQNLLSYIPSMKANKTVYDLDWYVKKVDECESRNLIKKVVRNIPSDVLPSNMRGNIIDVTVKSKKGPDDIMYDEHEILRHHFPRGLSIMCTYIDSKETPKYDCIINACKKFSGHTLGDEDEIDISRTCTEELYFLEDKNSTNQIVAMEKINGEAAHFACRFINDEPHFIAGSKNVHMIFKNKHQIAQYNEQRYENARVIADAFIDKLNSISPEQRLFLLHFLHFTKFTLVCEIMLPHHQHVVHFGSLNHNNLVVIALTPPPEETATSFTALPSELTLNLFNILGFDIPLYNKLDLATIEDHMQRTRKKSNTEGIVYYFENLQKTIGLVKIKSSWYVHLRAIRQQATYRYLTKGQTKTLDEAKAKSHRRIKELQKWLFTTEKELLGWNNFSDLFFDWLEKNVPEQRFAVSEIRENYSIILMMFLKDEKVPPSLELQFMNC